MTRKFFLSRLLTLGLALPLLHGCGGPKATEDGYLRASSNIWSGVKLYYGPQRTYVFDVVGGNDNYRDSSGQSFRGVKVRYPNGSEEWKDRDYIIRGDNYFVKADDPALAAQNWQVLEN